MLAADKKPPGWLLAESTASHSRSWSPSSFRYQLSLLDHLLKKISTYSNYFNILGQRDFERNPLMPFV